MKRQATFYYFATSTGACLSQNFFLRKVHYKIKARVARDTAKFFKHKSDEWAHLWVKKKQNKTKQNKYKNR